ncbi:hypothetical protein UPYG_G00030770 [Umbra pygmaea]|uniref:Lactosylceramide alpha-2,3-sialyltransferase n=1 Tax=Umbra pygmaea TaxID=75934 RepID=A0ABD0XMQ1_UMBPY
MRVMKKARRLLLVFCSMMVLGFLCYSFGRLHLQDWGPKLSYDTQRLLLKPDGKLLSATVLDVASTTEGQDVKQNRHTSRCLENIIVTLRKEGCKPGYAAAKMIALYPQFSKPVPMFLDQNFRRFSNILRYFPPFGIKYQDRMIDMILQHTNNYGLGEKLDRLTCKKCIIVGNGAILTNKSMGARINEYDVIVRLNNAPINGYEKDVGSRTTMRITYPEGAIEKPELYEKDSLFVLSVFKYADFYWLRSMILKTRLYNTDVFWKTVPSQIPRQPSEIRILNPYFIQEASFNLIGMPVNHGETGKGNIPTIGTVAITMAIHNCDEVAVAGFGYDMRTPDAPIHYYENSKMSAINESWTHNICKEKEFLIKLVETGVVKDLTNGILDSGC